METLNDILEESARKFGRKDALTIRPGFRTRAWTYRDLNEVVPRVARYLNCLLYTSPSPRDRQKSRMPSSA